MDRSSLAVLVQMLEALRLEIRATNKAVLLSRSDYFDNADYLAKTVLAELGGEHEHLSSISREHLHVLDAESIN